jgi:hypothetical protein
VEARIHLHINSHIYLPKIKTNLTIALVPDQLIDKWGTLRKSQRALFVMSRLVFPILLILGPFSLPFPILSPFSQKFPHSLPILVFPHSLPILGPHSLPILPTVAILTTSVSRQLGLLLLTYFVSQPALNCCGFFVRKSDFGVIGPYGQRTHARHNLTILNKNVQHRKENLPVQIDKGIMNKTRRKPAILTFVSVFRDSSCTYCRHHQKLQDCGSRRTKCAGVRIRVVDLPATAGSLMVATSRQNNFPFARNLVKSNFIDNGGICRRNETRSQKDFSASFAN